MKPFRELKILIIAPCYAAVFNRSWVKEMVNRFGVKVNLLTIQSFKEGGVRCYFQRQDGETYTTTIGKVAFSKRYTLTFFYTKIYGLIKKLRPDIIEIHLPPRSLLSLETIILRNILSSKTKVSFCSQENIPNNTCLWFRLINRIVLRYAQGANVCSQEAAEVLQREGFKGEVEVIPLAVDAEKFFPKDNSFLRKKLGLSGVVVGYLGQIIRGKGIVALLNAFKNITMPDIKLLVVGDGPESYLLDRNKTRGLIFVKGVGPDEVADYLNCMDILVCPSQTLRRWKEQFGRVIVEAMACGVAVIGSDSGAIPEVLGDAGLIFREGDVTDLTRKLMMLIENKALRRELGKKGRERVIARYTPVKVSQKYARLYQRIYSDEN